MVDGRMRPRRPNNRLVIAPREPPDRTPIDPTMSRDRSTDTLS